MKRHVFPSDYDKLFSDRFVIITGVSRSGTSILGKIVGSMKDAIYLYEPLIASLLPGMAKIGYADTVQAAKLMKAVLFEDYYVQALHGRNVNFKKSDESYVGNYQEIATVKKRWKLYDRRCDMLEDIRKGKYLFVMKVNEIQGLLPTLASMFKKAKVIHIIRNGSDVISSSLKRGWYSDSYLNNDAIDWMRPESPKIPWYVPSCDAEKFSRWSAETRIAYIWRMLVRSGMEFGRNREKYLEVRYEDLVDDPEKVTRACETFLGCRRTDVTEKNISGIKRHRTTSHTNQASAISKDELKRFRDFMAKLGYT